MPAPQGAKPTIHLRDYRAPAWQIDAVELEFDLDPLATLVRGRLHLQQREAGVVLRLDAEALEVLDVRVDGALLEPAQWQLDARGLTLPNVHGKVIVETRVRIAPERNTTLQGLYTSGAGERRFLLTQCEAEGFRHITPFLDRPDVLARYTVTLRADRERFPLLLANGNQVEAGVLADGRHFARFVDPHPKPSYLFALVAGELAQIEDEFVTREGRRVRLFIHADAAVITRCAWAMQCLKQAMAWDEQRFGRCYDLDVFHIVVTHDFAMGAMENKGLNIFNAKYLLADADSATDDDFRHVLAVVGHEYFHNWSGNRVTCRDWFQLSLKEGLTVYREQEFESDVASRTLRRIDDVRTLWRAQFAEDAGPLAHPVRPDRYSEINNFYTATVYEKGAEIVRMLATRLGEAGFRRGLDLYFERHDGCAVTVEDFLAALGDANGVDLMPWLAWYAQAGTPELHAHGEYDAQRREYVLQLRQATPATPNQPEKRALPISIALALLGSDGQALPLQMAGEKAAVGTQRVVLFAEEVGELRFVELDEAPTPSLLRGYSAPVRLQIDTDTSHLLMQVRHDTDGFNRWFAADSVARRLFAHALAHGSVDAGALDEYAAALAAALADDSLDPALVAEMLTLADAHSLSDGMQAIDPEAVHGARCNVENGLARCLVDALHTRYQALTHELATAAQSTANAARRRLRNACLATLVRVDASRHALASAHYAQAGNLSDRLAALAALASAGAADAQTTLDDFARRHEGDALVLDKWFALQAAQARPETLERCIALSGHAAFQWNNPNKVYALVGALAMRNQRVFHRADGGGYRFLTDAIARVDALTPQVAARLATAFGPWRRFEPQRAARMQAELEGLRTRSDLSPDLADILTRLLA
ncbi:MAG: aminopeptidase N [Dokdonella sp.]|uniref:aminopeptidase N n=1 Tax=Dokdonella sp. TaxID=2291710 RepID=UPI0025BB04B9|nr:aminopeptidase N [Dokdonella sp.]MBZ0221437.1 aminopeptidase N [Dokdonella sp.]